MSLDFDGGALQTQHEEDEYDQEDYAREQETMYCPSLPSEGQYMAIYRNLSEGLEEQVHSIQDSLLQLQQLLTDLPHDMLDDSGDQLSNYSDCSIHEDAEQAHEPWEHEVRWNDHLLITNPQSGYEQGPNLFPDQFLYDEGNNHDETHASSWTDQHNADKERCVYEIKEDYPGRQSEDSDVVYLSRDEYNSPNHCQQNNVYNLAENFRPYTNGHMQEFNNQQSKVVKFTDVPKEHLKQFDASEVANGQTVESYKVTYKPYQNTIQQNVPITQEATRRNEVFEEMQREFLGIDENSVDNMQILQLQVLNKARERQLEELNEKLEKSAQQIRYLNHQLAMVKDEKDGLALSLQESQKLYQNGKEQEVHLEGQIKALETQIQTLTGNEEQLLKQSKVAELAMESMQQQLLELRRSDSLQRAREQHETIVASLRQKYEEQVLSLEQKLDATNSALQEQKELCCNLRINVKQLEKMLEESKLEKTEIINRLTRSLEESQKQCGNLLQTGSIQVTNQLRFQLQQAQSAQLISNNMNKTLQEELTELKEEIALYEAAAKLGVFLKDPSGELHVDMTDSYVDLGIKKVNWKKSRFHSTVQNRDSGKELSKDEIILQLKAEMERLLGSNKMKRNQISQLQNDLKDSQKTTEELKQQLKADKTAKENEPKTSSAEKLSDTSWSTQLASDNSLKEELLRLQKVNQNLQQEAENYNSYIQELKTSEEELKIANQDLCSQMRQMIQDLDRDKQEAVERCERTYQQYHEDTKAKFQEDLMEKHAAEKEQLIQAYEETISQLKADMDGLNKEMIAVKECYIAVCGEKDMLETTLRKKLEQELQSKEEKFKKQLLEEKEESLNQLRTELEEKHRNSIITAKNQWLKEKVSFKQQIENEVALARTHWEEEQKEIKVQAIQEIEREWQSRLDQTLKEAKKASVELRDCSIQTEQVTNSDETSSKKIARMVEEQKLQLEEAMKEKEKAVGEALKELETELERKHHENIASQVETALAKGHARWLEELTELEEYKANLKVEREKWEKEHEISAAKQLSLVLSAAEEKWKKELETREKSGPRTKELEEKILSLRRELELKKEEIPAIVKAEVAQARAQWNKEKQEEILQLQKQTEQDYRSFLDDHRNKINEVLATAKEDLIKQKNELLIQKEAELKMCLDQKQREWAAQETKRLQEEIHHYEEKSLIELEFLLGEIHEELVKSRHHEHTWQDKCSSTALQLNHQYKEKLKASLQKAFRGTVYTILEKAKQEWREKQEELIFSLKETEHSCMQSGEGETGDKARPSMFDVGHQVEIQRILRRQPPFQDIKVDNVITDADQKCKKRNLWSHEDLCCDHCCQQLEKKEKECQDLKRKLDKVCRHLQLAVREHKAKVEQIQENERVLEALMEENCEMKAKLKDLETCNAPPRSLSEGAISKPCASCDGVKALEEMRSQYIKAVGKIKGDMLRYIHESKERAAEMIKAEVFRERQETARKMRKYYLICLQQLLNDDGKHEGAEKKIMNAASKLATMAEVLETPVRSKNAHSALPLNSELPTGVEQSKRNYIHLTMPTHMESKSCSERIAKKASDQVIQKRVPYNLRQQLDAVQAETQSGLHVRVTSNIQSNGSTSKQPADNPRDALSEFCPAEDGGRDRNDYVSNTGKGLTNAASAMALEKTPSCVPPAKFGNTHAPNCIKGLSESGPAQRPVLKEFQCNQPNGYWQNHLAKSEKTQGFDSQETPVRDERRSAEWNSLAGSLLLDSGDTSSLYPAQKANSKAQTQHMACEKFPVTSLFSDADENIGTFCRQLTSCKAKILSAKSEAILYSNEQLNVNPGHNSYQHSDKSDYDISQQNSATPCSNTEKRYNQHSGKLILGAKSFQQDSGFDSPLINLD